MEAVRQVERIAKDLTEHPDIVRQNFRENATWDEVHAVVLNASLLSFARTRNGIFCYDASAIGRFFKAMVIGKQAAIGSGKKRRMTAEIAPVGPQGPRRLACWPVGF